jgi:putative endonuclease
MPRDSKRALGNRGEELAARLLVQKGYRIVARNWRCRIGELDLVTEHSGCLVFVEVRTRRGESLGSAEESITTAKRMRLAALAESYVQACDWPGDWRIDVVAIELDALGRLIRLDHYENAVTG